MILRCVLVLAGLCLAGCAAAPVAPLPADIFADHVFARPAEPIRRDDVFALSDGMREFLAKELGSVPRGKSVQHALADALYRKNGLMLEYDSVMTRNAAQAFEARSGNCLSLVIMTAAIAKALGLQVEYHSALYEQAWSRSANLYLLSGHVNITLVQSLVDQSFRGGPAQVTIDFLPPNEIRGLRTRQISEHTVVAMYMNNRAAEALVQGKLDDAYWWARAAIEQEPRFVSAINTLGVIYQRARRLDLAQAAFEQVLQREPGNLLAIGNLARTLEGAGQHARAQALLQQLAKLEPYPPFYFFQQGQAAMQQGDYRAARDLFAKEVRRADYYHEFHFWLALAHFKLGETERAGKHLALAKDNSVNRSDRDLYAAKLAWLRSARAQDARQN